MLYEFENRGVQNYVRGDMICTTRLLNTKWTLCITLKTIVGEGNKHNVVGVMSNHSAKLINTNQTLCKLNGNGQDNDYSIILVVSNIEVLYVLHCVWQCMDGRATKPLSPPFLFRASLTIVSQHCNLMSGQHTQCSGRKLGWMKLLSPGMCGLAVL